MSSQWFGKTLRPGERASFSLLLSESYTSHAVSIPVNVWVGKKPGPTVFVSGAVHGDEINGTGTIRHIIRDKPFEILSGTLVLIPVVNLPGFERHTRYLPDRRDLNRAFPGSSSGSSASRLASTLFTEIVSRCDFGIDLHTAAVRRTNFPNVRADISNDARLAEFARAFGAELIIDSAGPKGSLRREACRAGCATLVLEAGEAWKVEPTVVEYTVRGIANCLAFLGMIDDEVGEPAYRFETDATKWVRAQMGGFLEFHVAPGDIVDKGDAIATNTDLIGESQNVIYAPRGGIILGMTTIPSVAPGDPVCHIAYSKRSTLQKVAKVHLNLEGGSLHERVRDDLASSIFVTENEEEG